MTQFTQKESDEIALLEKGWHKVGEKASPKKQKLSKIVKIITKANGFFIKATGFFLLGYVITIGMIALSQIGNNLWFENKAFNFGEFEGISDVFEVIGFITVGVALELGLVYGVAALLPTKKAGAS